MTAFLIIDKFEFLDDLTIFVNNSGNIQNVTLENVTVSGRSRVGGLVGFNQGIISDCKVSGKITGTSNVGGLIGRSSGTISNCTSIATTSGNNQVGALIGFNSGTISGIFCYSDINAIGSSNGTVENNARLYKLTLPDGVTTDDAKLTVGNNSYVTEGTVSLNHNDSTYIYDITDDTTVTLQDDKLYIGGDPIFKGYATFTIKNSAVTYTSDLSKSIIEALTNSTNKILCSR